MNRLVEYIIEAKDRTAAGIQSALDKVKRFGDSVSDAMGKIGSKMGGANIDEKFIHTSQVLDTVGRALDRMGVSGDEFNEVMDTLERQLQRFNQTGGDATQLFEHFKNSMADVGMSAKQIDNGIAMLKRNMVGVGTSGTDAAKGLKSEFRGVHSVISALQGNTMAAGRAFTWLLGHIKGLKVSASALSAISIGVFALTEVVSKAVSWWKEKKRKMEEIQQMRFENTLRAYGEAQKEVNRELKQGNREIDNEVARKKLLIETNSRLMQQELEMARVKALEGTSGAERDAVNRDFDAQAAALKAKTEIEKAQVEAAGQTATAELLEKMKARLEPQKAKMEAELDALNKQISEREEKEKKRIANRTTGSGQFATSQWGNWEYQRKLNEAEKAAAFEEFQASDEDYRKLREKRDRLKSQYDGIVDDIEDFADRKQKAELKAQSLQSDAQNTEAEYNISVWKEEEQAMHDFYEDMEDAAEQANRELERQARERARVEMELQRETLRDAQQNVAELVQSQRAAYAQLADAQNKVKESWGFYKDSGAMASYIQEQTREMEARKQYEKDVKSLKNSSWGDELSTAIRLNRRGETDKMEEMFAKWRQGSFGLSVEQEATMRVAVAKDAEKEAQQALASINEQVSEAVEYMQSCAEAVEKIAEVVYEGGEE